MSDMAGDSLTYVMSVLLILSLLRHKKYIKSITCSYHHRECDLLLAIIIKGCNEETARWVYALAGVLNHLSYLAIRSELHQADHD